MPLSALDTADRRFFRCSSLSMADSGSLAPMGPKDPPQQEVRPEQEERCTGDNVVDLTRQLSDCRIELQRLLETDVSA